MKQDMVMPYGISSVAYEIITCFGPKGCPNAINRPLELIKTLEDVLKNSQLDDFIKNKLKGQPLKPHHRFKVSISDCPNGCSQLYIADFGIHSFVKIKHDDSLCTLCDNCVISCEEGAIKKVDQKIVIDNKKCIGCGGCIKACPEGAIKETYRGYKIYVGGKLGRHPRLASFLTKASPEEVPVYLKNLIEFYQNHNEKGERVGAMIEKMGWQKVKKLLNQKS
jgi:dissimilatory sulfite reductase (desulfoviridin) alpha/beta subunit